MSVLRFVGDLPAVANPHRHHAFAPLLGWPIPIGFALFVVELGLLAITIGGLLARVRHAQGAERQQLKLSAYAARSRSRRCLCWPPQAARR